MSESTPLAGGFTGSNVQSTVSSLLTQENAAKTASYVGDKAKELSKVLTDANTSVRALALIGGVAMIVVSGMGLFGKIVTLKFVSAILELYTLLLGVVVVVLEADGKKIGIPRKYEERIRKYALFLTFVSGRGCLYFVAGTLQISQMGWVDLAVGGFMCFVGVMYIWVGRQASKKLSELRKSLYSEEVLQEKFNEADVEKTGTINLLQFGGMTRSLWMNLNARELDTAFYHIDTGRKGRISYQDFVNWWNSTDFDEAGNAEFGLSV